jgi:ABC-2 type transport system permease protein
MITYFKNLYIHRYLLFNLTSREIKSRYAQSILGYFWILLNPLFQMLIMSFVFSFFIRIPSSFNIPYSVFIYTGLLPWNLFIYSITSSTNSLIENESLIKKVYFPREIIITATIISKVYDYLLASTILVGFLFYYHVNVSPLVLFLPLILFIQILFSLGLSFILSALNLFYRDIQYLMNSILLAWFYLTPILYPIEMIPERYRFVLQLNPMSVLINAQRRAIFGGGDLNSNSIIIAILLSLTIFYLGYFIFKKLEGLFADVV